MNDPTAERLTFARMPPEPVRLAMLEWLADHGIDGTRVAIPGWVLRRSAHSVVVSLYELDADSHWYRTPAGTAAARVVHVQHLDGPPAPFPAVLHEWIAEGGRDIADGAFLLTEENR